MRTFDRTLDEMLTANTKQVMSAIDSEAEHAKRANIIREIYEQTDRILNFGDASSVSLVHGCSFYRDVDDGEWARRITELIRFLRHKGYEGDIERISTEPWDCTDELRPGNQDLQGFESGKDTRIDELTNGLIRHVIQCAYEGDAAAISSLMGRAKGILKSRLQLWFRKYFICRVLNIVISGAAALESGEPEESPPPTVPDEPDAAARWMSVSEAARQSGICKGQISKAATLKQIKSNDRNGPERLVDLMSVMQWKSRRRKKAKKAK